MGTTHQRGYVTPRGKQWYGYYRKVVNDPTTDEQKTVRVPVILGLKSKMSKFEAREALQREITKQVGQSGSPTRVMNDGSVTFAWFVSNVMISDGQLPAYGYSRDLILTFFYVILGTHVLLMAAALAPGGWLRIRKTAG